MMEKKSNNWLVGFYIATAMLLGFVFGFSHGIGMGIEECDKWKEMYDRHINEQWNMIERKDSMYAEYFKLRIEYKDGHVLEPKK